MVRTSLLFRAALVAALLAVFAAVAAPTLTKAWLKSGAVKTPESVLVCGADGWTTLSAKALGAAFPISHPPADPEDAQGHSHGCPYCGLAFLSVPADLHLRFETPRSGAFSPSFRVPPAPHEGWVLLPPRAPPDVV